MLNDASSYAVTSARAEKKLAASIEGKDKRKTWRNARSAASKKQKNTEVLETPVLRPRRLPGGWQTDEERHDEESTAGVRSGSDAEDVVRLDVRTMDIPQMNLGMLKAAVRSMGGQVARGARKAGLAEQATALRDKRLMECDKSPHMPAPDEQQQSQSMLVQQQPHQREPGPPTPIVEPAADADGGAANAAVLSLLQTIQQRQDSVQHQQLQQMQQMQQMQAAIQVQQEERSTVLSGVSTIVQTAVEQQQQTEDEHRARLTTQFKAQETGLSAQLKRLQQQLEQQQHHQQQQQQQMRTMRELLEKSAMPVTPQAASAPVRVPAPPLQPPKPPLQESLIPHTQQQPMYHQPVAHKVAQNYNENVPPPLPQTYHQPQPPPPPLLQTYHQPQPPQLPHHHMAMQPNHMMPPPQHYPQNPTYSSNQPHLLRMYEQALFEMQESSRDARMRAHMCVSRLGFM